MFSALRAYTIANRSLWFFGLILTLNLMPLAVNLVSTPYTRDAGAFL